MCPAMCPVIHFTALIFTNNAFHPRLVGAGLTVCTMHSFCCSDGWIIIKFALQKDILQTLIFRCSRQTLHSMAVDLIRALLATAILYGTKRLGWNAGFDKDISPYCLRRDVGTELTGRSWTENPPPILPLPLSSGLPTLRMTFADNLDRLWCE